MSDEKKNAITSKVELNPKKVELKKFAFNRKANNWVYQYRGWNGKDYTVLFQLKKDFFNKSPSLIEKETKWATDVGIYDYSEQKMDRLITTLYIKVPNMWVNDDPHKILSIEDQKELIHAIMRDAQGELLFRLAQGWMNYEAKQSSALEFDVDLVTSEESQNDKK